MRSFRLSATNYAADSIPSALERDRTPRHMPRRFGLRDALLLHAGELLEARAAEDFGYVDALVRVDPDAVRAPELAGLVAALGAVAADDRAVEVDEAEAVVQLGDVHDLVLVHV